MLRTLHGSPIVYLFLETSTLPSQRTFFETVLGLPLIEVEPHLPHHRHGVVKYDAGDIVLSLNLTGPSRFAKGESDAVTTVFTEPAGQPSVVGALRAAPRLGAVRDEDGSAVFTDRNGHHYRFIEQAQPSGDGRSVPAVSRLHLCVHDLGAALEFYVLTLGLTLNDCEGRRALLGTGSVAMELEERDAAVDGRQPRTATSLIVFHTADVEATTGSLAERGVHFRSQHAGFSEIGGTIRFDDPSGNRLCLYQPSAESLTWGSGPKVMDIAHGRTLAH
jgi:predicted enzyme related to lactoylglutathione lyase